MPLFIFGTFLIAASIVTVFISVVIQKRKQVNGRLQRQKMEFEYSQSLLNTKIEVQEIPGKPGSYNAVAHLRPWLQLEELTTSLRMVAKIPALKKG